MKTTLPLLLLLVLSGCIGDGGVSSRRRWGIPGSRMDRSAKRPAAPATPRAGRSVDYYGGYREVPVDPQPVRGGQYRDGYDYSPTAAASSMSRADTYQGSAGANTADRRSAMAPFAQDGAGYRGNARVAVPHDIDMAGGAAAAADAAAAANPPSLRQAKTLEWSGRQADAVVAYKEIVTRGRTREVREAAQAGLARTLIGMRKFAAALRAVAPLPEKPRTMVERERLAIAGEALLRMNHPEHAESVLEIALSGADPVTLDAGWVAPSFANLGKAYLKNEKPHHARDVFRVAARQFERAGKSSAAAACGRMADTIGDSLR